MVLHSASGRGALLQQSGATKSNVPVIIVKTVLDLALPDVALDLQALLDDTAVQAQGIRGRGRAMNMIDAAGRPRRLFLGEERGAQVLLMIVRKGDVGVMMMREHLPEIDLI